MNSLWHDFLNNAQHLLKRSLTDREQNHFQYYLEQLSTWNKTYNLIASSTEHNILERHFLDSLSLLPWLQDRGALIDIGSGAGFPGLVLAILTQHITIDLLEPIQKKARFLRHTIFDLGIHDRVKVHAKRSEQFSTMKNCCYDYATTRAVGTIKQTAHLAYPLLRDGGTCLLMRGSSVFDELKNMDTTKICKNYQWPPQRHLLNKNKTSWLITLKKVSRETHTHPS